MDGKEGRDGWVKRGCVRVCVCEHVCLGGDKNKPISHLMSSLSIILNPTLVPSLLLDTETQ